MIKFLIVFVFSILEMGCANYPAGNNFGMYSSMLNDANRFLPPNSRRYTGAANNTFRTLDSQARHQAFEDQRRLRAEQKEQKRAARKAEMAERQEAERQRVALLTPAQRQAETEARNKKREIMGVIGVEVMKRIMFGGGGGGGSTNGSDDQSERQGRIDQQKEQSQRDQQQREEQSHAPTTPNVFGPGHTDQAW